MFCTESESVSLRSPFVPTGNWLIIGSSPNLRRKLELEKSGRSRTCLTGRRNECGRNGYPLKEKPDENDRAMRIIGSYCGGKAVKLGQAQILYKSTNVLTNQLKLFVEHISGHT